MTAYINEPPSQKQQNLQKVIKLHITACIYLNSPPNKSILDITQLKKAFLASKLAIQSCQTFEKLAYNAVVEQLYWKEQAQWCAKEDSGFYKQEVRGSFQKLSAQLDSLHRKHDMLVDGLNSGLQTNVIRMTELSQKIDGTNAYLEQRFQTLEQSVETLKHAVSELPSKVQKQVEKAYTEMTQISRLNNDQISIGAGSSWLTKDNIEYKSWSLTDTEMQTLGMYWEKTNKAQWLTSLTTMFQWTHNIETLKHALERVASKRKKSVGLVIDNTHDDKLWLNTALIPILPIQNSVTNCTHINILCNLVAALGPEIDPTKHFLSHLINNIPFRKVISHDNDIMIYNMLKIPLGTQNLTLKLVELAIPPDLTSLPKVLSIMEVGKVQDAHIITASPTTPWKHAYYATTDPKKIKKLLPQDNDGIVLLFFFTDMSVGSTAKQLGKYMFAVTKKDLSESWLSRWDNSICKDGFFVQHLIASSLTKSLSSPLPSTLTKPSLFTPTNIPASLTVTDTNYSIGQTIWVIQKRMVDGVIIQWKGQIQRVRSGIYSMPNPWYEIKYTGDPTGRDIEWVPQCLISDKKDLLIGKYM